MDGASWSPGFQETMRAFSTTFLEFLPRLAVAAGLLLAGWLAGRVLRWMMHRFVSRLFRIRGGRAVQQAVQASGVERVASKVVGRVVFWVVVVFAAALAGEVLGLAAATAGLTLLMQYLPSVLAAVLIALTGLVLANLARDAVTTFAGSAGIDGRVPGQLVRYGVLLLAAVVALDQIGVDSTLLILAVGITLAALLGSAALAVGLGARSEAGNIIAVHYLSKTYRVGQRVRIGDVEGRIVELRPNGVVLDTPEGRWTVPGREFSRLSSCLVGEGS
jgi:small-conductance mechanosensitive channel